jgi:hypothetical protein
MLDEATTSRRRKPMKLSNLLLKLSVAGVAGVVLFAAPAMSAPLSAFPKDLASAAPDDDSLIVQVANRGGHRGGGAAVRGGGAVYRGGAVRGGAVVRGGTVARGGAVYATGGGYCDPNYQYCGGSGGYYSGGVYRSGGAVVRGGGAYARGGAAVRAGGARGAHVAHRGGGGRRR